MEGGLDKATSLSATIGHDTARLMDVHNKLFHQNQFLNKQVSKDLETYKVFLDAATVYKLRSERQVKIARDWITSDEPEASSFSGDLTAETMNASSLISEERYSLVATELDVDFDALHQIAKDKGDEAMIHLATILEQELAS